MTGGDDGEGDGEDARLAPYIDPRLARAGLDGLARVPAGGEGFGEWLLFSRPGRLGILAERPPAAANRQLIRAGARHLTRLAAQRAGRRADVVCMLSLLGWEEWETSGEHELLRPAVWFTNPTNGALDRLRMRRAAGSRAAEFVREALPPGQFAVCEPAEPDPLARRLYVARPPMLPPGVDLNLPDHQPEWRGAARLAARLDMARLRADAAALVDRVLAEDSVLLDSLPAPLEASIVPVLTILDTALGPGREDAEVVAATRLVRRAVAYFDGTPDAAPAAVTELTGRFPLAET